MSKIIGFLIGILALFAALFFVLFKKDFRVFFTRNTPFLKKRFLTTLAVLIAFLSNGKILASANELNPYTAPISIKDAQKLENIQKTKEWMQLKKRWANLKEIKSQPFTEISKEVEKQKEINNTHLTSLVKKGYISQNVAYIINYVYGELLFHKLRSTSGTTCYKMSILGSTMSEVREDLGKRLKLISDISKQGSINKNVLIEAEKNIARDIEFIRRAQKVFDKGNNTQYSGNYWQEEKALASFFKNWKVDKNIKVEQDAVKAAELIVALNLGDSDPAAIKLDQLKKFEEWAQIQSNWLNASAISQGTNIIATTLEQKRKEKSNLNWIEFLINKKKNANWILLEKLISAGIFTEKGAKAFNDIYGEILYDYLSSLGTCYYVIPNEAYVRGDLIQRLEYLKGFYKDKTINEETLKQAEENLKKDMEILLLYQDLWENRNKWSSEKRKEEAKKYSEYFILKENRFKIKDTIVIRKEVEEAIEIIQLLYSD